MGSKPIPTISNFRLPASDEAIIQISFRGKPTDDGTQHEFDVGIGLHNVSINEMAAILAMGLPDVIRMIAKQNDYQIDGDISMNIYDDVDDESEGRDG